MALSETIRRNQSVGGAVRGLVLAVDDDADVRAALVRMLTSGGYDVIDVRDGKEALAMLAHRTFDAVVTDVQMADIGGVELLRAIRQQDPTTSVLLVSGAPDLDSAIEGMRLGAADFLVKPFDPEAFTNKVHGAVSETRRKREERDTLMRARRDSSRSDLDTRPPGSWTGAKLSNRYLIGNELGSGGMSTVYEATREDLGGMSVALKLLRHNLDGNPEVLARFRREAETIARLNHPNIVRVLDFEMPLEGPAFIVMERLDGHSLASLIQSQAPLAPERVAFIALQVLFALSAAHGHDIIHRDLKPENVFLTSISGFDDIVRVLDFGIAKIVGENEMNRLTRDGAVIGTPAYMAPEQARGETVDRRCDLYSVGVLMYECLIGRPPFQAENLHALLRQIFAGQFDPLGALRPELDDALIQVVEKAMATDRRQRYESAQEMIAALEPLAPVRPDAISAAPSSSAAPRDTAPPNKNSGYFRTTTKVKER